MRRLLLLSLAAYSLHAQIGWTDMGSNTILKGANFAAGLSALQDCGASPPPAYCINQGANFGFKSLEDFVESAQSGAAYDPVHNHLYITGGGHNGYMGNQVYDLDVVASTLTRRTMPSPPTDGQYGTDLSASSTHTSQGLVYLPNEDAVFKWAIGVTPNTYVQQNGWWITNLRTTPTWVSKTATPVATPYLVVSGGTGCTNGLQTVTFTNGGGTGGSGSVPVVGGHPTGYISIPASGVGSGYTSTPTTATVATCTGTVTISGGSLSGGNLYVGGTNTGVNCVIDTSYPTESVLCIDEQANQMWRYNPALDTGPGASPSPYTALTTFGSTRIVTGGTCRVHPLLKVLVCVGQTYGFGQPSGIYSIPLTGAGAYVVTEISGSTTGCSALYSETWPGFVYDDQTGLFIGYAGTGNSITLFDYATLSCVTRTFSGGPTSSAYTGAVGGTYDRISYFPKLGKMVVNNNADFDMFSLQLHPVGMGSSTLTCKDIDGDGYGVGPGCLGPDADDSDATVNTTATVLSKYGNIETFLEHIGYQNASSLSNVYCIQVGAVGGSHSTNADTACTTPYPSEPAVTSPYIVIFRNGTWSGQNIGGTGASSAFTSGTASQQNIVMSYPGEQGVIDTSTTSLGSVANFINSAYTTLDGLKLYGNGNSSGYAGGNSFAYPSSGPITAVWNSILRCELYNSGHDSNLHVASEQDFEVDENVMHDPYPTGGQHNIYISVNTVQSSTVGIRRNLLYNVFTGGYPNLQINGRCNNCFVEQNIMYNDDGQQIALINGVTNSYVRNNLIFNQGVLNSPGIGLRIYNYDSGQCQVSSLPSICPWDQTGNYIVNNTFWTGTLAPSTGNTIAGDLLNVVNTANAGPCGAGGSPPCGNLGGNFFYNNLITNLASTNGVPPVYYAPGNTTDYLPLDTWANNNIQNNSSFPTQVASAASTTLTCATFNSAALSGSNCTNVNPQFTATNTAWYNTPALFNFSLQPGSPALGAGVLNPYTPVLDVYGNVRSSTAPALGAVEMTSVSTVGGSNIGGKFKATGKTQIH